MPILEKTGLLTAVYDLLLDHPEGLSEHALINRLKQQQHPLFISVNLSDVLSLFRTHFLLFHALYRLRDTLRAAGQFDLCISPLNIQLQHTADKPTTAQQSLNRVDTLRAYYLNLDHLSTTDRAAVEQLLQSSLQTLTSTQEVRDALAELGIEQPLHTLCKDELRRCYRQLVSLHHPDRGGCTERLQRINQAMDTLRKHPSLN